MLDAVPHAEAPEAESLQERQAGSFGHPTKIRSWQRIQGVDGVSQGSGLTFDTPLATRRLRSARRLCPTPARCLRWETHHHHCPFPRQQQSVVYSGNRRAMTLWKARPEEAVGVSIVRLGPSPAHGGEIRYKRMERRFHSAS